MKSIIKKIIKMVIIIVVIAVMAMALSGYTYVYESEEVPKELIIELYEMGFERDEDDEDVWRFDGELDGYMVHAYYDAYYNSGVVYGYDLNSGEEIIEDLYWDMDSSEFDSNVSYEF